MSRPLGTTPFPPQPPEPPGPAPSPWLPGPRAVPSGPATASASLTVGMQDLLEERLLAQRVLTLAGELDAETVNRAVASLALFDADGDAPVNLRLSGVSADVEPVLTLVDALDLMGAPVHATCLGTLSGAAVALLAVADRRIAGRHATVHLCEPRSPHGIPGRELEALAAERARQLGHLQDRISEACGRPKEEIAADMRAGKLLTADEARDYGLLDRTQP